MFEVQIWKWFDAQPKFTLSYKKQKYTSLATKVALAHHLKRRKIENGNQGAPKWLTWFGKGETSGYWALRRTFAK